MSPNEMLRRAEAHASCAFGDMEAYLAAEYAPEAAEFLRSAEVHAQIARAYAAVAEAKALAL